MPNGTTKLFLEQAEHLINMAVAKSSYFEKLFFDMLDAAFAPKQIMRQIIMIGFMQALLLVINAGYRVGKDVANMLTERGRKERKLTEWLSRAANYSEWKTIATMLDELNGHDIWRKTDKCPLYDVDMIKKRIKSTTDMVNRGDVFDLMFRLRGGMSRDQFGMQHEGLYSKAMAGTKLIVEKYHESMSAALNFICDSPISEEEIPTDAKLAFFNETRHAFGRTALLLSGGAFLGYYHLGVVKALFQEGLLPRVISGASAGSIMTAIIGTRTDQELIDLFGEPGSVVQFPDSIRTDFFRFSHELKSEIGRRLNYLVPQGLRWVTFPLLSSLFEKKFLNMDTEHFKKAMMQNIGLYTFQEAFDRTGRVINITVAPLNNYDPPRLLNYLTAPHVCVWSAASASCAIRGVFDSVSLIVKEPNGQFRPENEWTRQAVTEKEDAAAKVLYSDGSVENDLPMQQLSELFNVNHFIVSQVNPHSAIFSSFAMKATVWSNPIYGALVGYLRFLTAQCKDWLKNIVNLLIFRSQSPLWSTKRGMTQALTQEYEGRPVDVTIMPWSGHISSFTALTSAIKNPTNEEFMEILKVAETNTWPSISRIRAHCLVETTLDKCVQRLRKRITDEAERQQMLSARAMLNGHAPLLNRKDRTPSFYTSRSIVNLSGLSVADPLPPAQQARRQSMASGSRSNLQQAAAQAQKGLGDIWTLNQSRENLDHLEDGKEDDFNNLAVPAGNVPMSKGTKSADPWVLRIRSRDPSEAIIAQDPHGIDLAKPRQRRSVPDSGASFLNLSVAAGDVPLTADGTTASANSNGGTPIDSGSSNSSLIDADTDDFIPGVSSSDNLRDRGIYKSTSMANFYYKQHVADGPLPEGIEQHA